MTALLDAHTGFGNEPWAVEVQIQRALRKVAQHVQLSERS
ncbi:hypothetical protein Pgy4_12121, partial [Pseudomonas savastanoi pv. glycinea str. race 4]